MKTKTNFKIRSCIAWSFNKLSLKSMVLIAFAWLSIPSPLQAQDVEYTRPSWRFGVAAGANFNFYRGSTQQLDAAFTSPTTFHNGNGLGLYLAPVIEFHRPNTMLGVMFQAGYDNRQGTFDQITTPCNCPADLEAKLSYITVEPSLRFAPFKSNFYLYGGPRFAFNLDKSFTYQLGINPAYPNQALSPAVEGDFSDVRESLISMQIGAGYDIQLSSTSHKTQFILSPFVAYHPYFGQDPRSVETWNINTIRAGAVLKFGRGKKIEKQNEVVTPDAVIVAVVVVEPEVTFAVAAPLNVPAERRVSEIFPLRNYVFFDLGSTKIPSRYSLLKKEDVKSFREDQLEMVTVGNQSGRSARQMSIYYNVINILGERMIKYPSTSIRLVGSSELGPEDGKEMAESVKVYLVTVFGINSTRISTSGQFKPAIPSEKAGATQSLALLREGDRRVSIETNSPELLMEFVSGPSAPLKPLKIAVVQEAPIDSYVKFDVIGADTAFVSWSLQITDSDGIVQDFGPYTQESVIIPGKSILGTRPEGTYNVKMIGKTKHGTLITKETSTHMVLWTPGEIEEGTRFSIIFEFDESNAISIYEKYLTDVVTPMIPKNGTVIIHGHTDIIGDSNYNQKLSIDRANEVKNIIENSLAKAGRNDVKFEIHGFGEDESVSPFGNSLPEERFYNRTVIIDVIPAIK